VAAKADPKRVALLVVVLAALVVVVVVRLMPALEQQSAQDSGLLPSVGRVTVPRLGDLKLDRPELSAPTATRNLFTFGPPPTPTPDTRPTPTHVPTLPPRPMTPPPPTATPPWGNRPPPPAFTASFLGWLGPARLPIAVFRDGQEVTAVPQGGTLKDQFIVREVTPTGVRIGYQGYPEDVTTFVPLSR
jgi:hypothetical protein